jgi:hypothetical protein
MVLRSILQVAIDFSKGKGELVGKTSNNLELRLIHFSVRFSCYSYLIAPLTILVSD